MCLECVSLFYNHRTIIIKKKAFKYRELARWSWLEEIAYYVASPKRVYGYRN